MLRIFQSFLNRISLKKANVNNCSLEFETLSNRLMLSANALDLSMHNDEFESSESISDWQLVSDVEGWNSEHFETYDIGQTTEGSMTIIPRTSTWYQDYQGDLAFKEIAGDFMVTTHVSVTDLDQIGESDEDDVPNDGTFSLGGVMLRTPTLVANGSSDWESGNANFVFLSLGHGADGNMSFESKNTINSVSDLELIPADEATAELRVIRDGNSITTMYRYEESSDWTIAASFDRPDMPETLQVGLVGYSDYNKVSTFDPVYHNDTSLIDTPENAAASSNPTLAYNPDLQASFDYIRFERINVEVSEIDVVNSGFEDISTESNFNEFTFGPFPGWELYDPNGITDGGDGPTFYIGTLEPNEFENEPGVTQFFEDGAPEGSRVGIAFNFAGSGDQGEYGLQQTLSAELQANATYELSVEVGNIASGTATSGTFFDLEGVPDYRVELLAGGEVIAEDNNSLTIEEGQFETSIITFTVPEDHTMIGEQIGIRLVNVNNTDNVPAGNDLEVDFDRVRLIATTSTFDQVGNQTVDHQETLVLDLQATLGGGTPISYSATVLNENWLALDQELELSPNEYDAEGNPLYYETYQNFGFKWLRSGDGGWMYINQAGTLHDWGGSVAASEMVAELGELVYDNPSLLHDAADGGDVSVDGTQLTLEPNSGFAGNLYVQIQKTAGEQTETEIISVEVTNPGLDIGEMEDQSANSGESVTVELPVSNSSGDEISYEFEVVENIAADLQVEFSISADDDLVEDDYGYDYLGQQERWVQSSIGWIFITPEGTVHDWNGGYNTSPVLATLDSRYHADPGLLVNAVHVDISISFSDGELALEVPADFVGEVTVRVFATDGVNDDDDEFMIEWA